MSLRPGVDNVRRVVVIWALVAAAASVAGAALLQAASTSPDTILGCVDKEGKLRLLSHPAPEDSGDESSGGEGKSEGCRKNEVEIQWSIQGPEGPQGLQGYEGPQGPEGQQGYEGPQGDEGPQGPEGSQGNEGPQGDEGAQGPEGQQGDEGAKGPEGTQGPPGAQGPPGDPDTTTAAALVDLEGRVAALEQQSGSVPPAPGGSPGPTAPLYQGVLDILGDTGTILPLIDSSGSLGDNFDTVPGTNGLQAVFTWNENARPSDERLFYKGVVLYLEFNGTDEEADTPDDSYWSRPSGAFTVGAWINPDGVASNVTILAKHDETSGSQLREWFFFLNSTALFLEVWDESANAAIGRQDGTASQMVPGQWQFVVGTYDGGTASSGIEIYRNGVAISDANSEAGPFTATEDLATQPTLGFNKGSSGNTRFFDGKIAGGPLGPFFIPRELSPGEVQQLYELGRTALELP